MSLFEKGALEGFGYLVGMVVVVSAGLAICFGAIGGVVSVWRWMAMMLRGGCL